MKSTTFWDMTPCSPLTFNRRFGRIYCLHLQNLRLIRARNESEGSWKAEAMFPPKCPLTFNGLHPVISAIVGEC
jgi:hypothetical protein